MPELHEEQLEAISFAIQKRNSYIMADMGVGKTAIALTTMAKVGITGIVVAPEKGCYTTWPDEMRKWTPGLNTTILHGPDKNLRLKLKRSFYTMPWSSLKWFYTACANGRFHLRKFFWVFDEGSMLKSHTTQRFKMLVKMHRIMSEFKMVLSASPAPNGLHNLWPQYKILDGGKSLGTSFNKFRDRFFDYIPAPAYKTTIKNGASSQIYSAIRPITFRIENTYTKDIIYNPIYIDLPPRLQKLHDQFDKEFGLEFAGSQIVTASTTAVARQKLRQFMQGAMYLDQEGGNVTPLRKGVRPFKKIHNLKETYLAEILEYRQGKPLIIVIAFRFEELLLKKALGDMPSITGMTKNAQTSAMYIRQWNKKQIPNLLVHPQSLSHSVNMQDGGHELYWNAGTWSLEQFDQLNGRLNRQGQKHQVIVHMPIIRGSVDEDMFNVLRKKDRDQGDLLNAMKERYL